MVVAPDKADTAQKHNRTQVRADDYSFIGAFMGILLFPAVFLKRAHVLQLAAGGASLGLGAGVWVHLAKSFTEGREIKPEGMVSGGERGGGGVRRWEPIRFHSTGSGGVVEA